MTPHHHPLPETLISYVAGTLPNVISCVVACHLTLCRECADRTGWLGMLGGIMLQNLEAAPASAAFTERGDARFSAEALNARETLSGLAASTSDPKTSDQSTSDPLLPKPLARYLGIAGADIPWKKVVKGVRQHWVKLPEGAGQLRLLRLDPGKLLLEHTHTGMELTLVLQGVYGDHTGEYLRGDVIEWTEGTLHQPRVFGQEECICLIASENTPYFSRLVARLLRPIMGF